MQAGRRMLVRAGVAVLALMAVPRALFAGIWPKEAFESTESGKALIELFGTDHAPPSEEIKLAAPLIAENGAVVPIRVQTTLPSVRSIGILVKNNPRPLAASFEIPAGTMPDIACRIKMAETSPVMAVVQTESGLYSTSKQVKVTIGGCA